MNPTLFIGRPVDLVLNCVDFLFEDQAYEPTQRPWSSSERHYDSHLQQLTFSGNPGTCAVLFGFMDGLAATLQPFLWGFCGSHKVAVMAGGAVGGLLGGACGLLKSCGLGTSDEINQPLKKTVYDYAVRGASIGTLGSYFVAWLPAVWLGWKVAVAAVPILLVSVPVIATLGALSGIEFAYRGNRSVGYRVIDKVLEYTLPYRYFTIPVQDAVKAYRELKSCRYEDLGVTSVPDWVRQSPCPLLNKIPRLPVVVKTLATGGDSSDSQPETYQLYDYYALKKAIKESPDYKFPHNQQPVDWHCVYRICSTE